MKNVLLGCGLIFLTFSVFAKQDSVVYLHCDSSVRPGGGPDLIVNKAKKTISIVPVQDELPMTDTQTTLDGALIHKGTELFFISVNKYTLRYSTRAVGFNGDILDNGQCVVKQKGL